MPNGRKRGGGRDRDRANFHNKGILNEHDDRVTSSEVRRVSFKNYGGSSKNHELGKDMVHSKRKQRLRQQGWDNKIRAHLQDDDIEMLIVRAPGTHGNYKKSRSGNFHREGASGKRLLGESPSHWYKVTIRYGYKYEKDYLLKLLANYIRPIVLVPYLFKTTKEECSFLVDDHAAAEELLNADKRITVSDGWKLAVNVRLATPFVEVDDKLTEGLKRAMAGRYNSFTNALSLSKFHADKILMDEGLFCPLNRPNLLIAVLTVLGESIPELSALDLSDNMINTTDHLKMMVDKVPRLKTLHIGNNKLRDIKQLDPLKGLPLEEIILDGNTLCNKYNDRDSYIRAVRQRFPKVVKLDGVDLPPPILFDVEDEGRLPVSQASFMCDAAGSSVVRQFLEQYYQIYDSDTREPLLQAYHQDAQFSMDTYYTPGDKYSVAVYNHDSRNLLRINNEDRRVRLLRRGHLSILDILKSFPKTQHDPASFQVDLVVFSPVIIQICVNGIFKEPLKKDILRFFSRVFVIVPVGSGFCIVNEQLTILAPTPDQIKKAFKVADQQPPPPQVAGPAIAETLSPAAVATTPTAIVTPPVVEGDIVAKQQMVQAIALKTGMNLLWSEKCLVETNWNFDQAVFAFMELQKKGTIPPEAFIK